MASKLKKYEYVIRYTFEKNGDIYADTILEYADSSKEAKSIVTKAMAKKGIKIRKITATLFCNLPKWEKGRYRYALRSK